MAKENPYKTTALSIKIYKRIEKVVKDEDDFTSVMEFVRRACIKFLKQFEKEIN